MIATKNIPRSLNLTKRQELVDRLTELSKISLAYYVRERNHTGTLCTLRSLKYYRRAQGYEELVHLVAYPFGNDGRDVP